MPKGKKPGDKPELLTKEEMNNLMLVVSDNLYFNTLYHLLLFTGRRIGEIYGTYRGKQLTGGIKVKDVDLENKTLTTFILKTKKRKLDVECENCKIETTYKNKFCPSCGTKLPEFDKEKLYYNVMDKKQIPLKDNLVILLEKYIKTTKKNQGDFLFREWSLIYLKKVIKKHTFMAKITKNFSLHGFRHYFVTMCKREGLTNEQIITWTGHKRAETLNIYTHLVPKDVEEKINDVELL